MTRTLSSSSQKVQSILDTYQLSFEVVELPSSTRTAREAAESIGCDVGSIAKSLVFIGKQSRQAVLVIASGKNRVDEDLLAEVVGEGVAIADAKQVREVTGFAIGGVPPVGFPESVPVYIDADLMDCEVIWAAAGTPFSVFRLEPESLLLLTDGTVIGIT
ncbi:MAG: YbaK/EbsC family protein [Anaerolineales bacterium]|nr:YbaK/EbsC family protein [Anaerolineales bacterium]